MSTSISVNSSQSAPWWSFAHVWMVIAGPAVVVVASFITLYLAISSPNTVLSTEPTAQAQTVHANMAPAMLARNHAATGVVAEKPAQAEQSTPSAASVNAAEKP